MVDTTVVIDLANSPSDEDKAVMEFFETSGRNLLAAEVSAGVKRLVALSIIGADRMPDNGYYRAKVVQEKLTRLPAFLTRSSGQPSSWNSSEPSPLEVRMET